jgi:hypothetical protein
MKIGLGAWIHFGNYLNGLTSTAWLMPAPLVRSFRKLLIISCLRNKKTHLLASPSTDTVTKIMTSLLPDTFSIAAAAALCGAGDHRTFRRNVLAPRLVDRDERGRITRASLERHLGYAISADRYLAADQKLNGARQYQQMRRDAAKLEAANGAVR